MPEIFNTIENLSKKLMVAKEQGKIVGFVPTMGALHSGHLELIKEAQKISDLVVMSIFVNPTQFNDKNDLLKYPRTIEADTKLTETVGLDYLYIPDVSEIYPDNFDTQLNLDLGLLDKVMEGEFRPGHFAGVCQVVKRLLDLVKCDILVMGQKDFQQFTIVQYMIDQLKMPVKLHVVKTKRDRKGLALSSRNARLTDEGRTKASTIYRIMSYIKKNIDSQPIQDLEQYGMKRLAKAGFNPEYVTIVNGYDLQKVKTVTTSDYIVVCVAAWLEGVRLIDNFVLKNKS